MSATPAPPPSDPGQRSCRQRRANRPAGSPDAPASGGGGRGIGAAYLCRMSRGRTKVGSAVLAESGRRGRAAAIAGSVVPRAAQGAGDRAADAAAADATARSGCFLQMPACGAAVAERAGRRAFWDSDSRTRPRRRARCRTPAAVAGAGAGYRTGIPAHPVWRPLCGCDCRGVI